MKKNYTVVKTAEDSMTTYRVIGIEQADDAAADVLKAGTEITTRFGKMIGNLHELEQLLGIKLK